MKEEIKHQVCTHWGWFSLDEGAYRDYLAGKLWISWVPEKRSESNDKIGEKVKISEKAEKLRDMAAGSDAYSVYCNEFPGRTVEIPYKNRMSEISIEEMTLSVRSSNGLMRAGAQTFGKVKLLMERENGLRTVRNLGQKSEKEIRLSFLNTCYELLNESEKADWWQSVIDHEQE